MTEIKVDRILPEHLGRMVRKDYLHVPCEVRAIDGEEVWLMGAAGHRFTQKNSAPWLIIGTEEKKPSERLIPLIFNSYSWNTELTVILDELWKRSKK